MIVDSRSKQILYGKNQFKLDLCASNEIRGVVKDLYCKYRDKCDEFDLRLPPIISGPRQYYVYAWYTCTKPKKYFYVGMGKGRRCEHIKYDIQKAISKRSSMIRPRRYKMLQDAFGIDYEIIQNELTEYEAVIFEECTKLSMLENGETLLCEEGIPSEYLPPELTERLLYISAPKIDSWTFYKRFFDAEDPYFDEPQNADFSSVFFHNYGDYTKEYELNSEMMMNYVSRYVSRIGGKQYKEASTRTATIIVVGHMTEDLYRRFRDEGKKIISLTDAYTYLL